MGDRDLSSVPGLVLVTMETPDLDHGRRRNLLTLYIHIKFTNAVAIHVVPEVNANWVGAIWLYWSTL